MSLGFSGSMGGNDAGQAGGPAGNVKMMRFENGKSVNLPVVLSTSGDNSSTTRSGISGGNITLTDNTKQKPLTG